MKYISWANVLYTLPRTIVRFADDCLTDDHYLENIRNGHYLGQSILRGRKLIYYIYYPREGSSKIVSRSCGYVIPEPGKRIMNPLRIDHNLSLKR